VDYSGGSLAPMEGIQIQEDRNGHARLTLDTGILSVSQAITRISQRVEVKDLSVASETIDETVVSLYKEFAI